jgi:hypothetical protein
MSKPKLYTLKLTHEQAVTAHFAITNYREMLRAEIKTPTRPHGPAESAMALLDLEALAEVFKAQVTL